MVEEGGGGVSKSPTYRKPIKSIALAVGIEMMAGEEGVDWESANLEPQVPKQRAACLLNLR